MTVTKYKLIPGSTGPEMGLLSIVLEGDSIKVQPVLVSTVIGDDGTLLFLDSMPHTADYDSDGNPLYDQVTDGVNSWRQTYTWTDGNLTAWTGWEKQ